MSQPILGIDIGGSGIKGNLVDLDLGEPVGQRLKVDTPQPSTPEAVTEVLVELVGRFDAGGPVGCTFPAVIREGVALTAANVDPSWIGRNVAGLFEGALGRDVVVVNDADAAGLAEMSFGAARNRGGVVICLTFGTGIGSALFTHGVLVPNTEFGHLNFRGYESVEDWAAASVRDREDLSWSEWGKRVDVFLRHLEAIFSPDLIVVGGGVSRKFDRFSSELTTSCEVVPAHLQNDAGIVGAAMAAASR
ncbi:MAG: polyphosphate--glucose phosphotransferase [Actinomycetota bacterium]